VADSQWFSWIAGRSVEGRDIVIRTNFDPAAPPPANITLLIGGQHGDEPATVDLLESFEAPEDEPVAVLARANPDGLAAGTRTNARGVDPNRNCEFNWSASSVEPSGPRPWSEPESRAVRDFIVAFQPTKIVSLHWALAEIDADGAQSSSLAEAMWASLSPAQRLPYRLRVTAPGIARPLQCSDDECPGSLGQWCGFGLRYADGSAPAMITLELPYDPTLPRPETLPADHLQTVHAAWQSDRAGYLAAVEPAVHAMLRAACRHRRGAA
jgi:hypothetical protein